MRVVANQTPHYTSIPLRSDNPQPSHPPVIPAILHHSEPPPLEVAKWGDPLSSSPLSRSQAGSYSSTGHKDGDPTPCQFRQNVSRCHPFNPIERLTWLFVYLMIWRLCHSQYRFYSTKHPSISPCRSSTCTMGQ